jgi:hypothetical protein
MQNDWDDKGVLKMLSGTSGSFTNILDKVGNSALAALDSSRDASSYQWDILPLPNREAQFRGKSYNEYRQFYWDIVHDMIITCDIIAVAGDAVSFIPGPAVAIGNVISAAGSSMSYKLTREEYNKGKITKEQIDQASVNWLYGLIPGIGIAFSIKQLHLDLTE